MMMSFFLIKELAFWIVFLLTKICKEFYSLYKNITKNTESIILKYSASSSILVPPAIIKNFNKNLFHLYLLGGWGTPTIIWGCCACGCWGCCDCATATGCWRVCCGCCCCCCCCWGCWGTEQEQDGLFRSAINNLTTTKATTRNKILMMANTETRMARLPWKFFPLNIW